MIAAAEIDRSEDHTAAEHAGVAVFEQKARKTSKKAYPRSIHGVPANGVLHPAGTREPDRAQHLGLAARRRDAGAIVLG